MAYNEKSLENMTPGANTAGASVKFAKHKRDEARAWNDLVDVGKELQELLEYGKKLMKNPKVAPAQKVTVWKALFEKLADKVMPAAKVEEGSKVPEINFSSMPEEMIKKPKDK